MKKTNPITVKDQFSDATKTNAKPKKKALPPLSLRLSAYIRSRLFDSKETPQRMSRKPSKPPKDLKNSSRGIGKSSR